MNICLSSGVAGRREFIVTITTAFASPPKDRYPAMKQEAKLNCLCETKYLSSKGRNFTLSFFYFKCVPRRVLFLPWYISAGIALYIFFSFSFFLPLYLSEFINVISAVCAYHAMLYAGNAIYIKIFFRKFFGSPATEIQIFHSRLYENAKCNHLRIKITFFCAVIIFKIRYSPEYIYMYRYTQDENRISSVQSFCYVARKKQTDLINVSSPDYIPFVT